MGEAAEREIRASTKNELFSFVLQTLSVCHARPCAESWGQRHDSAIGPGLGGARRACGDNKKATWGLSAQRDLRGGVPGPPGVARQTKMERRKCRGKGPREARLGSDKQPGVWGPSPCFLRRGMITGARAGSRGS